MVTTSPQARIPYNYRQSNKWMRFFIQVAVILGFILIAAQIRATSRTSVVISQGLAASDVRDTRIDVAAQMALMRMSRSPEESIRNSAFDMATAVRSGGLAGIWGDDLQATAQLAVRLGTYRWMLVPNSKMAIFIDKVAPPAIVFRSNARDKGQALDLAIYKEWHRRNIRTTILNLDQPENINLFNVKKSASSGVDFSVKKFNDIKVIGRDINEFCRSIINLPDKKIGETKSQIDLYLPPSSGRVPSAKIIVTISVTLPEWPNAWSQCIQVQNEWRRLHKAVDAHEDGHVAIVKKIFAGAHLKLIGKTSEEAYQIIDDLNQEVANAHDRYDALNNHGVTMPGDLSTATRCNVFCQ